MITSAEDLPVEVKSKKGEGVESENCCNTCVRRVENTNRPKTCFSREAYDSCSEFTNLMGQVGNFSYQYELLPKCRIKTIPQEDIELDENESRWKRKLPLLVR